MGLREWRWPANLSFPSVIQKVKSDGVLTPLLWLCGLSFIATLVTAFFNHPVVWVFAAISCASAFWVMRSFDFFRATNPMLLQSEKHQVEMAKQQRIATQIATSINTIDATPDLNSNIAIEHKRSDSNA